MIDANAIRGNLCKAFCAPVTVNAVPSGFAVSTPFADSSGDLLGFYVVEHGDEFRIEDDGEYLARLIGSGIPIDKGYRAQLLNGILRQGGASWDRDTFEIKSSCFAEADMESRLVKFLSALIRVRGLELLT